MIYLVAEEEAAWTARKRIGPNSDECNVDPKECFKQALVATFRLDDETTLVVALPGKAVSINDFFKYYEKPTSVEGLLTATDDPDLLGLLPQIKDKKTALFVADKVTLLDDKNVATFPRAGSALVEGVAVKGEYKVGSKKTAWAIKNADGYIPLLVPADSASLKNDAKIRVTGRVRVSGAVLSLEVVKVEAVKK
jgi:hypothetical protein